VCLYLFVWCQQHVCHLKSVPFRGVQCSDAAGKQFGFSDMMDKVNQSFTGILWDNIAQSPFATYKVIVLPYLVNVTVNRSHNCMSLNVLPYLVNVTVNCSHNCMSLNVLPYLVNVTVNCSHNCASLRESSSRSPY